jgi:gliding motility-associated-like protein
MIYISNWSFFRFVGFTLFAWCFIFDFFAQHISLAPIGEARISVASEEIDKIDLSNLFWVEDVSERTAHAAIYRSEGGFVRAEFNHKPIHRKINGKWERIDATMIPYGAGSWYAPNQDFPVYLYADGRFELSLGDGQRWSFGSFSKFQNQNASYSMNGHEGNTFFFSLSNKPIVKELLALENAIKYNYRIVQNLGLSGSHVVFTEKIVLPKGYYLEEEREYRETIWGMREVSNVYIKDKQNRVHGTIYPAYAVDANKESEAASLSVNNLGDGEYELHIALSNQWLNASNRAYPVILDPLVVGPISQWTGGQIPSCMSPQQYIDSILVTIPAGITPISLAVRSSFYADPWTGASMSMGAMQFSTSCNATGLYQVQGPDGNFAGTAYIDSANMMNPLICCIPKSCSQQQFYLRKHLSRTALGIGCNTSFIRYDPFTTQWPFRAVIYGRTPEAYASEWSVSQTPRCSDDCDFNASAYVRYGVPPYTITHPWQDTTIIQGSPSGCSTGQTIVQLQLTIPDCPIYCDENYTSLPVPTPNVVDACGAAVTNFPLKNLNIKPAPKITPFADTIFCAGETIDFNLSNCLSSGEISWSAEGLSGSNQVNIPTDATLAGTFVYNFLVTASANGCDAEPYFQPVYVLPVPTISFEVTSQNTFLGDLVNFQNTSTGVSLQGNQWLWDFGDSTTQIAVNGQHTYADIGTFQVCLSLMGGEACANSYCKLIPVVPNAIDVPNVFSPNGDGSNDVLNLFFDWAEKVELNVLNRWGSTLASVLITDYESGWNGKVNNSGEDVPDGVYFYSYTITTKIGGTLSGHSFVHLIRE